MHPLDDVPVQESGAGRSQLPAPRVVSGVLSPGKDRVFGWLR